MAKVNIYEAKTHFSKLVARALAGEEIVVARAGKPLVKIVPVEEPSARRTSDSLAGLVEVPEDFDDPLPDEVLGAFGVGSVDPDEA